MIRVAMLSFWHVHAKDYARQATEHPDTQIVAVWDELTEHFYDPESANEISRSAQRAGDRSQMIVAPVSGFLAPRRAQEAV